MATLTAQEFDTFTKFIYELTGIALDNTKAYLVETRLAGLVREQGCGTYSELFYKVKNDGSLRNLVIDRITTQETSFFRDQAPFEMLKFKIIPDLVDARRRQFPSLPRVPIRIWSAACATGQEIYSIAISLKEVLGDLNRYAIKILGTDISDAAVAKASAGAYSAFEMDRGVALDYRSRHFQKIGDEYKINDEIRAMVNFRRLNLHEDFSPLGRWDIVFCRNVAIYFNDVDKKDLFLRLHHVLESDGALIVGSTESLLGICPAFESRRYLRSIFYSKIGEGSRP